jgi:hypothetical protein
LYLNFPLLYVGCDEGEVLKLDVSSPCEVKEVQKYKTEEKLRDVIEYNGYLIIAFLEGGVKILNNQDGEVLTHIKRKGYPHKIKTIGNFLYLSERTYGVRVFDISSITKPREIIKWKSPSNSEWDKGWTLDCNSNYIWIGDGNAGVRCLKMVKRNLKEVWIQKMKGSSRCVVIKKNKLYTTQVQGELTILSPLSGKVVGSFFTPDNARGISYRENFIYVADGKSGLYILEWSPSSLKEIAHYKEKGCFWDVKVEGNYIYTTNGIGVMILRFEPIERKLTLLKYYKLPFPGNTHGLYLRNNFLFVACGKGGGVILNKISLTQIRHIKAEGYCWNIYFSPPYLFLSCNNKGVEIFEFDTVDMSIKKIKNWYPSYEEPKIRVTFRKKDILYVGGRCGIHLLKIPSFKEIKSWKSPRDVCDIYVDKNDYIYASCGNSGIYILSNKKLREITHYPSLFWCYSLCYSYPYLYCTDEEVGIMILEIKEKN